MEIKKTEKKVWIEPELTKDKNLNFINVTMSPYMHKQSDHGCGLFEEIITLGLCKAG